MRSQDAQKVVELVQQTLDEQKESSLHRFIVRTPKPLLTDPSLTVRLRETRDGELRTELHPFEPILDVRYTTFHIPPHQISLSSIARFASDEILKVFAEEQAALTYLLANSGQERPGTDVSATSKDALDRRATRAFRYSPTYHLTFSLFSGASSPSAWDIKAALDEYLAPLLESFSSISTFTVDTQVQLYASLPSSMHGPTLDESSGEWILQHSDLSGFINAAEWPLSPSIGVGPTINFVLYVPSEKQRPLVIHETKGTSWLIPQWGGVQISNLPISTQTIASGSRLTVEELGPIMHIFADQLKSLLGVPDAPSSLPLQLASLTRERAVSLVLSSSSTLGALARLSQKLTSIAIPDVVASSVRETIRLLDSACSDFRNGGYADALKHARVAEAESEQAFFEPSMVGQVYFPDEHKVAVYVPLLGPIAVPLVMAAIKEIRKIRRQSAEAA